MSHFHLLKQLAAIKVNRETLEDRALEVATPIALSPNRIALSDLREKTEERPLGEDPTLLFTHLRYVGVRNAEENYLIREHDGVNAHPIYVVP